MNEFEDVYAKIAARIKPRGPQPRDPKPEKPPEVAAPPTPRKPRERMLCEHGEFKWEPGACRLCRQRRQRKKDKAGPTLCEHGQRVWGRTGRCAICSLEYSKGPSRRAREKRMLWQGRPEDERTG